MANIVPGTTNALDAADIINSKTTTFNNVEAMQLAEGLEVGDNVRTLGYYTPGDGGGNDYEIVAAATGTDDGGSFIDLSGSGTQAKGLFLNGVKIEQFDINSNTTLAFAAALTIGAVELAPGKTYTVSGVVLLGGSQVFCKSSADRATIKLADNSNAHVIRGDSTANVSLINIIVDGNKLNQSIGTDNNWRCVYFTGDCSDINLKNIDVVNSVDHGLFMSGELCGVRARLKNIKALNCGLQAHQDQGGAGGSGLVGGSETASWVNCYASGNLLNGFKAGGEFLNCHSENNIGGGWETGFSTPKFYKTKYLGCSAKENGGSGWRHFGQGNWISKVACVAERNAESGVSIVNSVKKVSFSSCWFIENGQSTSKNRSDTSGYDGVFISATSGFPEGILFSSCQFIDEQSVPTQDYHIHIGKPCGAVTIESSNIFDRNAINSPLFIAQAASLSEITVGNAQGLSTNYKIDSEKTVTNTTSETGLLSYSVDGNSFTDNDILKINGRVRFEGTAGSKTIRIKFNGNSYIVANVPTGSSDAHQFKIKLMRQIDSPGVLLIIETVNAVTSDFSNEADFFGSSYSSDISVEVTAQNSDIADASYLSNFSMRLES